MMRIYKKLTMQLRKLLSRFKHNCCMLVAKCTNRIQLMWQCVLLTSLVVWIILLHNSDLVQSNLKVFLEHDKLNSEFVKAFIRLKYCTKSTGGKVNLLWNLSSRLIVKWFNLVIRVARSNNHAGGGGRRTSQEWGHSDTMWHADILQKSCQHVSNIV